MTTNIERAAATIREAFNAMSPSITLGGAEAVIAQALADAGLLRLDLPEPAYEGSTIWFVPGKHEWQVDTYKGQVMLEVDVEEAEFFGTSTATRTKTWFMDRDEARALVLAILAADRHAEQEQDDG